MESPLLAVLSEEQRRDLLRTGRRRRFARNEVVFHEGDPADTVHLIVSGRLIVRVTTPYGDEAAFTVSGAGEFIGEMALLSPDARRSATVAALEPSETVAFHRDGFEAIRRAHPAVDTLLLTLLADRIRRLSDQLVEALFTSAEARVARQVAALAKAYGNGEPGTLVPLTQQVLAGLAGTSRATVNRVLRDAERKGAVVLHRGSVEVVDAALLPRRR